MPELPEVHTTATILNKLVKGRKIMSVWTDYNSPFHTQKDNVKNPKFFADFEKTVKGAKILKVYRRAKNVLIDLSNDHTILIHMKMTGHLLYGTYTFKGNLWHAVSPPALKDPFNKFIHLVFSLDNKKHLALCDMRKFAKVTLIPTPTLHQSLHLDGTGPEPLESSFTYERFKARITRYPNLPIKGVLMNPEVIAGIGNIYSDEILWVASIHPLSQLKDIPEDKVQFMFKAMKDILRKGISFGGDSTSDYRNPYGLPGEFQYKHKAYRRTGETCTKPQCGGTILRIAMNGRGAHFCDTHQKLHRHF